MDMGVDPHEQNMRRILDDVEDGVGAGAAEMQMQHLPGLQESIRRIRPAMERAKIAAAADQTPDTSVVRLLPFTQLNRHEEFTVLDDPLRLRLDFRQIDRLPIEFDGLRRGSVTFPVALEILDEFFVRQVRDIDPSLAGDGCLDVGNDRPSARLAALARWLRRQVGLDGALGHIRHAAVAIHARHIRRGRSRSQVRRVDAPSIRKHHRPVAVEDHAVLQVHPHRAGEHAAFDVAAFANEILGAVTMRNVFDVLFDDRAFVEV